MEPAEPYKTSVPLHTNTHHIQERLNISFHNRKNLAPQTFCNKETGVKIKAIFSNLGSAEPRVVREIVEGIHTQPEKMQKKFQTSLGKMWGGGGLSGNWHHKQPFKQFAKQDTSPRSIRVLYITEGRMRINKAR